MVSFVFYENFYKKIIYSGRAFSLYGETGMSNGKPGPKKKSLIGVKASAAEAGRYTREAGVLAYYEVNYHFFYKINKYLL